MHSRFGFLSWFLVLTSTPMTVLGQATLSANSGINSADTWFAGTLTMTENGTVNLSSPQYNPQTQTMSSSWAVPSTLSYNIEAGYDANGGLVVNLYPINLNPSQPPSTGPQVSAIRYAGGQMSVFDLQGNPYPMVMPDPNTPVPTPFSFLGSNPGSSIIGGIVVPNDPVHLPKIASQLNASLAFPNSSTAAMSVPAAAGSSQTAQISYAVSGSYWVAQSITLTTPVSIGTSVRTFAFSNVGWNDNAVNDNIRAGIASTIVAPPAASTPPSYTWPVFSIQPTLTGGIWSPTNCNYQVYQQGGPQNVAFGHGFTSDPCTWVRMVNWLNQDFRFGTEVLANTGGTLDDTTEGNTLINQIESAQGNGYVLIGHSNGGLVARYAAQYFQNSNLPTTVLDVATIDTPHQGANITVAGPDIVAGLGAAMLVGCILADGSGGCLTGYLMVAGGVAAAAILQNAGGALEDMYPGSNFLQTLNAANETFGRAGIIGHADRRWSFVRYFSESLIGNSWKNGLDGPYPETTEPCNPEDSCGERAAAQTAEVTYDSLLVAIVVDAILGIFDQSLWAIEPYLIGAVFAMDAADLAWNLVTDFPGDGTSDALVSGSSQSYPGGATEYIIEHADSHSGALRSQLDHTVLDTVLANQFHVPTQASCPFATSPGSLSSSALATSGSLTLETSAGCEWSASSNAPWLRISSGINGISTSAISYSVLANPSTIPRQGTIQVGNGFSSAALNFYQAGVCTYTFSPGPEIASPPPGETSSITVKTQINCPWTVTAEASWLSVTSGSSGIGTGSFTFTAAPNTASADRTGSISLMGQTLGATLTVADGIAAGTPGYGTVTVSGYPGSYEYNPCQPIPHGEVPPPCWKTVYESGTVSVIVAGDTFSAAYSGTSPSATALASGLASEMNYPLSPVSATVSGTTITITSTINGAATDYPLVTSATFNPFCTGSQCFTTPAFIATPSGPNLTGGTD
jgi:pimeloyl-ACP methyl ester carboxylesterase